MIFELYFESNLEAEKAQMYQKLSNLIIEYRAGENWIKIDLPDLGKSPEDTLRPLIENIWDGNDIAKDDFINPRMSTHITMELTYPIRFTVWNNDRFIGITL
jgi:hypothetical protein